jgi:hypothetical protein
MVRHKSVSSLAGGPCPKIVPESWWASPQGYIRVAFSRWNPYPFAGEYVISQRSSAQRCELGRQSSSILIRLPLTL